MSDRSTEIPSTIESVIASDYVDALDARLDSHDAYIEYQQQEARRALPFLAGFFDVSCARVLEIGAGRGGKGIAYAQAGMRVVSLDVDVAAVQVGLGAAQRVGVAMNFLVGNGARLPFSADSFDAILLDSVIEHVADPYALLSECHRVLRRQGIVFVVFPPFYGPLSGHIDDYVLIPWFHLLPRALVERKLLSLDRQIGILTPRDAYAVFATLNRLTIFGFRRVARRAGFTLAYWRVRPFLTHPGTRVMVGLFAAFRHPSRIGNLQAVLARARREFTLGTFVLFLWLSVLAPLVFVPIAQEIAVGGVKAVLKKG
ncbi:MAG: class I SAM-dependent methyltransferase [Chloroflexi bacterium]|nr:class I SAM-dependent methyltransferase [Chloroflexota bacterium]